MKKKLLLLLTLTVSFIAARGQTTDEYSEGGFLTFRFPAGKDMFYRAGNEAEIDRLYSLVDKYRADIASGKMPVYVDGYCASQPTQRANIRTAYLRASRVKSELVVNKGLIEDNFITKNHTTPYTGQDGTVHNDMVTVRLRFAEDQGPTTEELAEMQRREQLERERLERERLERERLERERAEQELLRQQELERAELERQRAEAERERAERERAESERAERERAERERAERLARLAELSKTPCFTIHTNLLYDAFLVPTLGVEWRVNRNLGIKLDGSLAWWGSPRGKVQKMWMLNPEVRWYLLEAKRFYVGASGNFGKYNIYKGMLGGLLSDDTGYQGSLWNAGLTVGYRLDLSRSFAIDFNVGLGYTRMQYDSFRMQNQLTGWDNNDMLIYEDVRVSDAGDQTRNFWGPTQAGVSLVWKIGGKQ